MSIVMQLNPFELFVDTAGTALDAGYIWIGEPNKDPRNFPVTVYYDEDLTIPAPMPLRTTNGYVYRNGSPTFLYINGNYSIMVLQKTGTLVYYVPDFLIIGNGSAVSAGDLANQTDPLKGAALVGYRGRTVHDRLDDQPSLFNTPYSAKFDGVTDDSAAIQAMILDAALGVVSPASGVAAGKVTFPIGRNVKIASKVLVPGQMEVDLNGCTIIGSGIGGNIVFESATLIAGALVSNVGSVPQTRTVSGQNIHNGIFRTCGRALNLYNCIDNCVYEDMLFSDCTYNIYASRCFFVTYRNMMSRGTAGGAGNEAYHFDTDVNAVTMENVTCNGRAVGFDFSGGVNGLSWSMVNAESCGIGFRFVDQVSSFTASSGYAEFNTTAAFDFTNAVGKYNINIDGYYFNGNNWPIIGVQMFGGRIGSGCYFVNNTFGVVISDVASTIEVCTPDVVLAANGAPLQPSGWSLGTNVKIVGITTINTGSGTLVQQSQDNINGKISLNYTGDCGYFPGEVPFVNPNLSGGTVILDTKIVFNPHVMTFYDLTVTDGGGTVFYRGRTSGTEAYNDSVITGHTVVVNNVGGFIRLELSGHVAGFTCEGIIRL